jgi:hypothetical protein
MSTSKCRKTYEKMKTKRLEYPFEHSGYKLKEVATQFESGMDDVRRIAKFKNGKGTKYDLRSCTSEDIYIYLRKTPELIAWYLGFHVLYGIDGLKGDGVPPTKINYLKKYYSPMIERIVDDCDRVSDLIRTNINYEYENFKHGESDVFELLRKALDVTDRILSDAGLSRF